MKSTMIKIAIAALLSASAAFGALAEEFTKGVVNKVDAKAKKVTIKHEDLKNLDMPAMTMVFRVEDQALLEKLKEGSSIEFVAERLNGKLTVTEVK
ncbi:MULTISPECIES: copper-binding protein [Rhizobium]|uniref:copper-binding protein n=1 Tax=Rhizobium TaxID=379 RepID=UPI0007EA3FC9|nr:MULTISPECIES: copper-binding protein [Rhizobium]ANK89307.1 copper-binding periplasmic protein CusF [Rhizobium sp. N731]ANK94661.1 copper-binding periplasmic protein CusF [Rhizobium sp. N6212]ANL00711.1 copper-binding periplasmic protein CusF [Rhizobium sp. N621]ANL06832.1 copper-binding periplasmic protein CusF [Rhizobium esperanzae]ANL13002.1 copper-binding periplasmic protein CusF [Rhizobium sp. N1341]